ncbi:MAG: universal stress protein [Planctomycetota bacterium]
MYDHILVALDGSEPSRCAGRAAIALATALHARVTACHVYGADIHRRRFVEMEPGLSPKYQGQETLDELRTAHDRLMNEGFRALSAGYVEDFVASCRSAQIDTESAAVEGRSYVGILHLARTRGADLIVLGVDGLGAVGNGMLGGTTSRVLAASACDVLVVRHMPEAGPVLVGVDGSEEALEAAECGAALARALDKPLHIVTAYDPVFHTHVFGVMARSLSPQRQDQVGLASQEKLHDDIINDGLGKLYAQFLQEAEQRLSAYGVMLRPSLATGKAYCALDSAARDSGAELIVVGRYGHHRQSCSRLGSNAEALIRTTSANVLLVGGVDDVPSQPKHMDDSAEIDAGAPPLAWDCEAEARLQRVPSFVRRLAKRTVENAVRELGKNQVCGSDFDAVAARFGMGLRKGNA